MATPSAVLACSEVLGWLASIGVVGHRKLPKVETAEPG